MPTYSDFLTDMPTYSDDEIVKMCSYCDMPTYSDFLTADMPTYSDLFTADMPTYSDDDIV